MEALEVLGQCSAPLFPHLADYARLPQMFLAVVVDALVLGRNALHAQVVRTHVVDVGKLDDAGKQAHHLERLEALHKRVQVRRLERWRQRDALDALHLGLDPVVHVLFHLKVISAHLQWQRHHHHELALLLRVQGV
eukprot:3322012-Pleurochrysis_carterae.AAC.1